MSFNNKNCKHISLNRPSHVKNTRKVMEVKFWVWFCKKYQSRPKNLDDFIIWKSLGPLRKFCKIGKVICLNLFQIYHPSKLLPRNFHILVIKKWFLTKFSLFLLFSPILAFFVKFSPFCHTIFDQKKYQIPYEQIFNYYSDIFHIFWRNWKPFWCQLLGIFGHFCKITVYFPLF